MWEDKQNKGRVRFNTRNKKYVNKLWEDLLLSFITEKDNEISELITGVLMKACDKWVQFEVWVAKEDPDSQKKLQDWFRDAFGFSNSFSRQFKSFTD